MAEHVTAEIALVRGCSDNTRKPVIAYLRDLEIVVRCESDDRQAIQVIALGRRLLSDRGGVGSKDGSFSRS